MDGVAISNAACVMDSMKVQTIAVRSKIIAVGAVVEGDSSSSHMAQTCGRRCQIPMYETT